MFTGRQVKAAMIEAGITKVDHHDCGICGFMTAYVRDGEDLYFDSGCGCSTYATDPQPRSWDHAAKWINTQNDEHRNKLAASFGLV